MPRWYVGQGEVGADGLSDGVWVGGVGCARGCWGGSDLDYEEVCM